ncbi:Smad nuclear-interacting protein 1 [Dinochytrium kinnereticum]|nr:Smad nuclear-interacting protein 1 [Dinochytrium kinnereticum]
MKRVNKQSESPTDEPPPKSRRRGEAEEKENGEDAEEEAPPKERPNYGLSGALAAEGNTFKGVLLKYSEPPEARKTNKHFRLYIFKGKDQIDMLKIHRQSAYLIGRDRVVADIPVDHPSCSKQHAVLQYRQVYSDDGTKFVKPYIIDLESANGTFINSVKIAPSRYYELKITDSIKFGFSSREYVLMAEEIVSGSGSGS